LPFLKKNPPFGGGIKEVRKMSNYEWTKYQLDACVKLMRTEKDPEQKQIMKELADDLRAFLNSMTVEQAEASV
jgi:hypothetical protein